MTRRAQAGRVALDIAIGIAIGTAVGLALITFVLEPLIHS